MHEFNKYFHGQNIWSSWHWKRNKIFVFIGLLFKIRTKSDTYGYSSIVKSKTFDMALVTRYLKNRECISSISTDTNYKHTTTPIPQWLKNIQSIFNFNSQFIANYNCLIQLNMICVLQNQQNKMRKIIIFSLNEKMTVSSTRRIIGKG